MVGEGGGGEEEKRKRKEKNGDYRKRNGNSRPIQNPEFPLLPHSYPVTD